MGLLNLYRDSPLASLFTVTGLKAADLGSRGGFDPLLLPVAWATDGIGFEPDPEAFARLQDPHAGPWRSLTWLPFAVGWEDGMSRLHVPHDPQGASLLEHNARMADLYGHQMLFSVARTVDVRTVTLDSLLTSGELPACDYIKLDIEGAEFPVLRASPKFVGSTVAIRLEAAFIEQRVGQALVGELLTFMRSSGFELADIMDIHRWRTHPSAPADPYVKRGGMPYSRGMPAQCDLLFLRSFESAKSAGLISRLALIYIALGYFDRAEQLLGSAVSLREGFDHQVGGSVIRSIKQVSRRYGRVRASAAIWQSVRGLVPLARSALVGLPGR